MVKTNVTRLLTRDAVPFEAREYSIADGRLDALAIAEKVREAPEQVFKTLVTEAPGPEYFVFVIPAPATLDLKKAAVAAGVKSIEMLPQKQLFPLTGYVHGGCSPIGMKKAFPTFFDETAVLFDHICVSGGHLGVMIRLEPETLCGYAHGVFADLTR